MRLCWLLLFFSLQAQAATVSLSFDRVPLVQFIEATYRHMLAKDYVIDPALLDDERKVSIQVARIDTARLPMFLDGFLQRMGVQVSTDRGVVYFGTADTAPRALTPSLHTLIRPDPVLDDGGEAFVYRPKFREVAYLLDVVTPFVPGVFSGQRPSSSVPSVASTVNASSVDVLLFKGTAKRLDILKSLLQKIDTPAGEVLLRGMVYEVTKTDREASAVNVVSSLLGDKLQLMYGNPLVLENSLKLKTASLDAVASALASDSRFKVLSSPSLRVRSGAAGRFSVGQEVPVLGALTFPQGSAQPVQSVEYRSSGVIFEARPQVRESVVDLAITQQLSNFVRTETGVNNSPTLIKREVKTDLSLQSEDVVVLGGLAENKNTATRSGLPFLPSFLHSRGTDSTETEILLVFQVERL